MFDYFLTQSNKVVYSVIKRGEQIKLNLETENEITLFCIKTREIYHRI